MMPNAFHESSGYNLARDQIYIVRICQYVDICKHFRFPKSYDVMAKSLEDRPPPCFFDQIYN